MALLPKKGTCILDSVSQVWIQIGQYDLLSSHEETNSMCHKTGFQFNAHQEFVAHNHAVTFLLLSTLERKVKKKNLNVNVEKYVFLHAGGSQLEHHKTENKKKKSTKQTTPPPKTDINSCEFEATFRELWDRIQKERGHFKSQQLLLFKTDTSCCCSFQISHSSKSEIQVELTQWNS